MTQDEIICMAERAGKNLWPLETEFLLRLAALVRADEREACAKACEEVGVWPSLLPKHCAEAIRARGQA